MKIIPIFLLSSLVLLFFASSAQAEWQIFGEKSVNLALEADEFVPNENAHTFSSIKLKVLTESVYLHHISVQYNNGEQTLFVIKKKIKDGSETDEFAIPPNSEGIKKIKMLYKTNKRVQSKATIVFLGK